MSFAFAICRLHAIPVLFFKKLLFLYKFNGIQRVVKLHHYDRSYNERFCSFSFGMMLKSKQGLSAALACLGWPPKGFYFFADSTSCNRIH